MFAKILAVAACAFAAVVSAQQLQFTQTPANAEVGVPTVIKWAGGDGSPVTITLREGDPKNLATIAIITGDTTGTSFTWTPDSSLPPNDDYALQISQGVDETNFSGQFSITGGEAAVSTTIVAVGGSTTVPITTLAPNSTAVTATTSVSVTAILTGTGSSAGTGTALPRNTTFFSQTLTATSSFSAGVSAGTTPPSTATTGAATTGSSPSSPVSSTGAAAALGAQLGSLGLGALAAAAVYVL